MKTLEEAAEKYLQEWRLLNNIHLSNVIHAERCKNDFIAGANYQAERMYSEEQVIELLEYTRENFYDTGTKWHEEPYKDLTSKELLEQFKKK